MRMTMVTRGQKELLMQLMAEVTLFRDEPSLPFLDDGRKFSCPLLCNVPNMDTFVHRRTHLHLENHQSRPKHLPQKFLAAWINDSKKKQCPPPSINLQQQLCTHPKRNPPCQHTNIKARAPMQMDPPSPK